MPRCASASAIVQPNERLRRLSSSAAAASVASDKCERESGLAAPVAKKPGFHDNLQNERTNGCDAAQPRRARGCAARAIRPRPRPRQGLTHRLRRARGEPKNFEPLARCTVKPGSQCLEPHRLSVMRHAVAPPTLPCDMCSRADEARQRSSQAVPTSSPGRPEPGAYLHARERCAQLEPKLTAHRPCALRSGRCDCRPV